MPLPENLLSPIPGPNPSGENLHYARVYDDIKEARREDDDAEQGDWKREVKKADFAQVIKLGTDALAKKTKDLQIAAWVTEALLRREKFAGLRQGLDLVRGLIETFWDTIYPEPEDGDLEMRVAPLDWVGFCLGDGAKSVPVTDRKDPLTKFGFNWYQYKESRAVGYEAEVADSESRRNSRATAIAEGKLSAEVFDEAFAVTKKAYYQQQAQDLAASLESLLALDDICKQKFGSTAPGFGNLRTALEEVQQTVRTLLKKKEEQEPDLVEPEIEQAVTAAETPLEKSGGPPERAPVTARNLGKQKTITEEPADREDAIRRVILGARYLRQENPSSPVSYLILRGMRWGELRSAGSSPDPTMFEPPPTEVRQQLKRHALAGQWAEVLEAGETAMALSCGRGWLDLQRYIVRACDESGYGAVSGAIMSELRALLIDFPQFPDWMLMDDTPVANSETQAWLRERGMLGVQTQPLEQEAEEDAREAAASVPPEDLLPTETAAPDPHQIALEAARDGRVPEAMEILTQEIAQERSGRARFQRKIQLAAICLSTRHEAIAFPILEELANEIERRKLDEWEAPNVVAQPLALLYKCLDKLGRSAEEKQKIYERICRLDPIQALDCQK